MQHNFAQSIYQLLKIQLIILLISQQKINPKLFFNFFQLQFKVVDVLHICRIIILYQQIYMISSSNFFKKTLFDFNQTPLDWSKEIFPLYNTPATLKSQRNDNTVPDKKIKQKADSNVSQHKFVQSKQSLVLPQLPGKYKYPLNLFEIIKQVQQRTTTRNLLDPLENNFPNISQQRGGKIAKQNIMYRNSSNFHKKISQYKQMQYKQQKKQSKSRYEPENVELVGKEVFSAKVIQNKALSLEKYLKMKNLSLNYQNDNKNNINRSHMQILNIFEKLKDKNKKKFK